MVARALPSLSEVPRPEGGVVREVARALPSLSEVPRPEGGVVRVVARAVLSLPGIKVEKVRGGILRWRLVSRGYERHLRLGMTSLGGRVDLVVVGEVELG